MWRLTSATALILALCSQLALADSVYEHELRIAASPDLRLTDADLQSIIASANALIEGRQSSYNWDVACSDVKFVKAASLIEDKHLLTYGSYFDLTDSLNLYGHGANVLVVTGISCGDVPVAAGCSPVGGEPLIVATQTGMDGELWAHERAHGVGRAHTKEKPTTASSVAPQLGKSFMFWQLARDHLGKSQADCDAFRNYALASIVTVSGPPPLANAHALAQLDASVAASLEALAPAPPDEAAQAATADLTLAAFRVVGAPWEAIPAADIKALNDEDVGSIRKLMHGPISPYWPQAMFVLGLRGGLADLDVIEAPLKMLVAGPDKVTRLSGGDLRALLRAKLMAPTAIGILSNRLKSDDAVGLLGKLSDPGQSRAVSTDAHARPLSIEALKGLALVNSAKARQLLDKAISRSATPNGPHANDLEAFVEVPDLFGNPKTPKLRLRPKEVEELKSLSAKVSSDGVEAAFQ